MDKVIIRSYTDKNYTEQYKGDICLQINPSELKFEKGIKYRKDMQLGALGGTAVFDSYNEQTFAFETTLDATGVLPEDEDVANVQDLIDELEDHLYLYNSEGHRPPYVMIVWGEVIFRGQLSKMETQFTMFGANGLPLRAKVSLAFCGFMPDAEERKRAGKSSPDMSHIVVLQAGETIASVCQRIYGDSLLVDEVAKLNGLSGFRKVVAGTELLFPHLKKGRDD